MAAALRALFALLQILPKQEKLSKHSSTSTVKATGLPSLFDIILPCLLAGLQVSRQSNLPMPRSSSNLQATAFSWNAQPRTASSRANNVSRPSNSSNFVHGTTTTSSPGYADESSAGETDRQSDKSESERSDFSTISVAGTSSRACKDESRQKEAVTKLIRQNSLHCLIQLNRHESRALVSRWGDLLPDQPALLSPITTDQHIQSSPRLFASSSTTTNTSLSSPNSLCTLISTDPSTSIRIAAMAALESILTHGTLQLSMAQERAQRALTFTSLSSQLAAWIVNVRSYVVTELQRASMASRSTGNRQAAAYPSGLTIALLQLTRAFLVSTTKAKLILPSTEVLRPAVIPFGSSSDPEVQTAAKRVMAALTAATGAGAGVGVGAVDTTGSSARKVSTPSTALPDMDSLWIKDGPSAAKAERKGSSFPTSTLKLTGPLSQGADLSPRLCEQVLSSLEAACSPIRDVPTWCVLVKSVTESGLTSLFKPEACQRLVNVWRSLSTATIGCSDQHSVTLATLPDLFKVLFRYSGLTSDNLSMMLEHVQECCSDSDEAVRAAAVRVLGLLVLPTDNVSDHVQSQSATDDDYQQRILGILQDVLWNDSIIPRKGLLQDESSLVRQRASWAFSNAMESFVRSGSRVAEIDWQRYAQYCFEAGTDIEGVAVSACRASGSLLALLPSTTSDEACCMGKALLDQLCRVLGTSLKPPKSRWNAACALDRALSSDVVVTNVLEEEMMDRVVDLLCCKLEEKVFKVRVSAANALVSLCVGSSKTARLQQDGNQDRLDLVGQARCQTIASSASARLVSLRWNTAASKESDLYMDELKRLLHHLVVVASCFSASSPSA
nr:conserved hypothetical protein [Melanopsichium pennsylvanicum 4]